jgi:toxin ParE1/3/4
MVGTGQGRYPIDPRFHRPGYRHYARKVVQDIVAKADNLDELPRRGRVFPELGNEAIRELSLYSYRILYEIRAQNVFVLTVIHKRRDLQPEMIEK